MTSTMSDLKACISEMPAALMAVSSELSPRFPKTISERTLTEVSENNQRTQQDGQRQRLREQHQSHIPEELGHNVEREAFTNQLINISPQELHHQHKLADEERSHEKQSELLGDKDV